MDRLVTDGDTRLAWGRTSPFATGLRWIDKITDHGLDCSFDTLKRKWFCDACVEEAIGIICYENLMPLSAAGFVHLSIDSYLTRIAFEHLLPYINIYKP